jgi:ABC-type nitrate/sulfonate/bicarbonate transport system permease component
VTGPKPGFASLDPRPGTGTMANHPPPPARPARYSLAALAQSALLPLALLVAWEAAVRTGYFPPSLIASPSQVAWRFGVMAADGSLLGHALVSLKRLAGGFALGAAAGVLAGALAGYSKTAARVYEPTILSLIPIPPVAWIPLLILVLGIGDGSKIALIAIGSFATLFVQTAHGVRSTDRSLIEVGYVFEKSPGELLWRVLLPSALPDILVGLRVALGLSWSLLLFGEVIASSQGLGWLIWDSRNFSRSDDLIVGMLTVGGLGKLSDAGLDRLGRAVMPWRRTYRDGTDE